MKSIATVVKDELALQPLLRMLLGSDLINMRAMAKQLRPRVEAQLGTKVGLETIAIALHREAADIQNSPLDALLTPPDVLLHTAYHGLVEVTYAKGTTGSETIPDEVRYFAQTTGSSEHTIIISKEDIGMLDTSKAKVILTDLSGLCLSLPPNSPEIESLYARIFLYFGLKKISIIEIVSTTNEITIFIEKKDYSTAYSVVSTMA